MGLFGGKSKPASSETKPAKQVESLLKDIVQKTENMPIQEFIAHQFAEMNPDEKAAVAKVAASGDLRTASGALSGRLQQGLQQMTDANKQYQSVADKPISIDEVMQSKNNLANGLYKGVQNQAAYAGGVGAKFGDAGRAAARRGANNMAAMNKVNPALTNLAISQVDQSRSNTLKTAGMQNDIAAGNVNLGRSGIQLGQQATANQLGAGNMMQAYQNSLNTNNFQNANAQALFPWEQVQNKLNVLNEVSPMAGSKTVGSVTGGVSKAQQLAAIGMEGVSLYGSMGGFNSAGKLQNSLDTGATSWDKLNSGVQTGNIGGIPVYAQNANTTPSWYQGLKVGG